MDEKKEREKRKNCSSYYNEKISNDAGVSEFYVTNLTIEIERMEINGWKEKKERKKEKLFFLL